MKLRQFFNNWVRSSPQTLQREYHVEYELKNFGQYYNDPFPTVEDFINAYNNSDTLDVTPSIDREIDYRSRTKSKESLIDMIKQYRSYPEFRNEKTVEEIYDGFANNRAMEMPIVIQFSDHMRVFSGNTRMDVAFQLSINPKVVIITID